MIKHRIRRLESLLNQCELEARKPLPRRLQTVQDVIDLLEEQVAAIRQERWAGTLQKARTLGYLAGVARKAIEASVLGSRLEMLEAVLKARKAGDKR